MLLARKPHPVGNRKRWTVDYSDWLKQASTTLEPGAASVTCESETAFVDDVVSTWNKVFFYLNDGVINETFTVHVQVVDRKTGIKNDTIEFFVI